MQVPMMIMKEPINMPARRPRASLVGPVKKTAESEPMLYIAVTIPVLEPATDL